MIKIGKCPLKYRNNNHLIQNGMAVNAHLHKEKEECKKYKTVCLASVSNARINKVWKKITNLICSFPIKC